jgi:hypothetical protein
MPFAQDKKKEERETGGAVLVCRAASDLRELGQLCDSRDAKCAAPMEDEALRGARELRQESDVSPMLHRTVISYHQFIPRLLLHCTKRRSPEAGGRGALRRLLNSVMIHSVTVRPNDQK